MPRRAFFPNPNNKPVGFSPAVRAGDTVFVSGQVSLDGEGKIVGEGDAAAQAEQCLRNIDAALAAAGATRADVAKITAFIVNPEDYAAYSAARLAFFGEPGPASSTVFIKGLVDPRFLVEIEATAVV